MKLAAKKERMVRREVRRVIREVLRKNREDVEYEMGRFGPNSGWGVWPEEEWRVVERVVQNEMQRFIPSSGRKETGP